MTALKGIKKTIRENVFEQEKKKHKVQFNPVLALIVLPTIEALCFKPVFHMIVPVVSKNVQTIGTIIWKRYPDDRKRPGRLRRPRSLG